MAGTQHTQTYPKFIYTFLAVHRDCIADGKNTVHVAADTLVDACEMLNDMGYISATWKGREENTLFIQKCENNFTSGYKSEGEMILSIASDYAEYVAETRYRRKFTEDVSHA